MHSYSVTKPSPDSFDASSPAVHPGTTSTFAIQIAYPGCTALSLIAHLRSDINVELAKTTIKIHLKRSD